ncbi:hypothetical protein CB1_000310003 [Camelus ferus]|nr:hypothetical protein CB1_000310003 [Camelus ferus]
MESGAGKHWTEEEVKALLSVWAEKNVRKQLYGTLRNKGIFLYIAKRLQALGVHRDWKQCRAKYKNLKYEYRTVKYAHNSGDSSKTMKFFHDLDAILQYEPATQLTEEDANSRCLATLSQSPAPETIEGKMSVTLADKEDISENPLLLVSHIRPMELGNSTPIMEPPNNPTFIPTVANEGGKHWTVPEVRALIGIWSDRGIQQQLERTVRNKRIFEQIAAKLQKLGIDRDWKQCRTKYKNLKHEYKTVKMAQDLGMTRSMKFFTELDSILGHNKTEKSQGQKSQDEEQATGYAHMKAEEDQPVLNVGKKLYEGKTKEVYELLDSPGKVLLQSKDQITAGNAARKNHLEGKAAISNKITSCIFQLLQESGIKTAFTRICGETAFIAPRCEMIPIEWVCRRIATGSFLKRNPGVKEGYKFYPPKVEMFFKDDANNDPQWSEEQLIAANFCFAGLVIGQTEVDIMSHATQAIFEILEKSWLPQNCTLVDMKIEFGVDITTKEIVLADVIDNDSWRLWPSGDRSQQKDKQSYRDLKEVTPEGLQMVKKNFEWVAERVELLLKPESQCRVVVLMGSTSDLSHCEKIKKACGSFGIPCELRVEGHEDRCWFRDKDASDSKRLATTGFLLRLATSEILFRDTGRPAPPLVSSKMASSGSGGVSVPALWSEVNRYGQNGDFTRALKTINKILQINKDDVTALHCKVVCLIQNGSFKEALNVINTHTKVLANNSLSFEKAYCEYRLNRIENALKTIESANQQTDKLKELYGQVLYRLERYDECLAVYRDLVRNSQDDYDEERKTNLSAVVAAQSNWEKVVPENLGLQEGTHELCYNAACALIGQGQLNQAMKILQKAEDLCRRSLSEDSDGTEEDPQAELAIIHGQMAYILQLQGRTEEALQLYNQIIKLKPTDVALLAVIANNIITINKDQNVFDSKKKVKLTNAEGVEFKLSKKQLQAIEFNKALLAMYTNQVSALVTMYSHEEDIDSAIEVFTQAIQWYQNRQEKNKQILVLGLDGAGKTSVLHSLALNRVQHSMAPTQGFNAVCISTEDSQMEFLEIGGSEPFRSYWEMYLSKGLLLIFVVDSADHNRLPEAKKHLHQLIETNPILPLVVFANKQDLEAAYHITDIHEALALSEVGNDRKMFLFGTQVTENGSEIPSVMQDAKDLIAQLAADMQ